MIENSYNKYVIYSLFFLVFFSNILINVDHGTLPGSTEKIKEKLKINDFGFGILGSVVYAGLTCGSMFATMVFSYGNMIKPALSITLFLNAISLLGFTMSYNFYLSCILRTLIGFF